jgi:hypothetical protein
MAAAVAAVSASAAGGLSSAATSAAGKGPTAAVGRVVDAGWGSGLGKALKMRTPGVPQFVANLDEGGAP